MMEISKIRAISLDLDDTLWPVWPTIDRAEIALSDWLAARAPATATLFTDRQARLQLREEVLRRQPGIGHDLSTLRRESIRLGLQQSGEDSSLAEPAFEVFFDARQRVDLFEDARPALAFLAARFPLVALSNGNADVGRVGIGEYFAASVSAQAFGVAKPDPRIFHAAAEAVGVRADAVLHIGDDGALDVLGALDAGMQTVWVNRTAHDWTHPRAPHLTVTELGALCQQLAGVAPLRAQKPG
jgi:FMN hydrolase / 5-amino-6-(5-phospho-D-ribitylamino)uracil phosphatase